MDFEKEIPVEDFDTDFDTKEITPIKSLRSDPPPQYFTNIDGKYCKDVAGREELDELKAIVDDVPWQPLEDGYSNFWFELTNDTLSPWLNFSAKTENAVIDWGDGSGEVALDTLTPTHTYSKAGRYIVKVKGVTGIAAQHTVPYIGKYLSVLKYVELNDSVISLAASAFNYCAGLRDYVFHGTFTSTVGTTVFGGCTSLVKASSFNGKNVLYGSSFSYCFALTDMSLKSGLTTIESYSFLYCVSLQKITIPSTVTLIGSQAFSYCRSLSEIHIQATTPPTLSTNVFAQIPSNYIIYVPVGYGDTYKAASGWSTYADHILEEGQTPNRAMLAKFKEETNEPQDDMR